MPSLAASGEYDDALASLAMLGQPHQFEPPFLEPPAGLKQNMVRQDFLTLQNAVAVSRRGEPVTVTVEELVHIRQRLQGCQPSRLLYAAGLRLLKLMYLVGFRDDEEYSIAIDLLARAALGLPEAHTSASSRLLGWRLLLLELLASAPGARICSTLPSKRADHSEQVEVSHPGDRGQRDVPPGRLREAINQARACMRLIRTPEADTLWLGAALDSAYALSMLGKWDEA